MQQPIAVPNPIYLHGTHHVWQQYEAVVATQKGEEVFPLRRVAYDFTLVVTCGLNGFTRVFPGKKHITGEETIKILLEGWPSVYVAPKVINSNEDVRVRSDTGWWPESPQRPSVHGDSLYSYE